MYIRTSERSALGLLPYNLGEATACAPDAATNGTLCSFNSQNGGATTAVFVPDAARGTDPVCLLVWFHGDLICGDEKGKNAVAYVKSKTFPLAQQLADSKRPFVLVVPSLWKKTGQDSHTLGSPQKMNAFLEEVRTGLTGAGWSSPPAIGRLILAGHSRGYAVLNGLAARVNDAQSSQGALATLTDVWLFDTTYGERHKEAISNTWKRWATVKSGVNLHILYLKNTRTAAVAGLIRDKARATGLTNIKFEDFDYQPGAHCAMPRLRLPDLLAAAGDCPLHPHGNRTTPMPLPAPNAPQPANGSLFQRLQSALANGQWYLALSLSVMSGDRDVNRLTNTIFFARHRELKGRKLLPTEPNFKQLSQEWLAIRDTMIRPFLAKTAPAKPPTAQPTEPAVGGAAYPEVNTPLPPSGPGFIRRKDESRSYGLPETIRALQEIAAEWHKANPRGPRIVISDISPQGGSLGQFKPHSSHRVGLDVDLNLEGGKASWYNRKGPKVNNRWKWEENPRYSRSLTRELTRLILEHPKGGLKVKFILFDDPEVRAISSQVKKDESSPHLDHLHVRFCAPSYFQSKVERYQC
jgi:hypothetical protein